MFPGLKNPFVGSLYSKPLHGLLFKDTWLQVLRHGNTLFCFNGVAIKSPEEDLQGKVPLQFTRLENDFTCLLSNKMVGKYK